MFKVIKIHKYTATSFVDMINLETGAVSKCFDYSAVVSYNNFEFIKEGEVYDCKIELFGEFLDEPNNSSVEITIIESGIIIGNTKYLKVLIDSDVYYIPESAAKGFDIKPKMHYDFTRKDLIQVDDVIHADCL